MISAWRIVKTKHAPRAFTGEGAKAFGGRWNSPGVPVVYLASTASLAMLEMLVHLGRRAVLDDYVLFHLTFAEQLVLTIAKENLPKTWRKSPPPVNVQRVGDAWALEKQSALLRVPSAVVPGEANFLLNPAHPDFASVKIDSEQNVRFDPRLERD